MLLVQFRDFFFAKIAVNLGLNCKIFYIGVLHNMVSEFSGVHKKFLICVWGTTPQKGKNHEKQQSNHYEKLDQTGRGYCK